MQSDSLVLQKRYKRIAKVLRQIDAINAKGGAKNDDQRKKVAREEDLVEQKKLIETMASLGFEARKKQLAKQSKKINKKLRQIDELAKKDNSKLNADQRDKIKSRGQFVKQQDLYNDLLKALATEEGGGEPPAVQTAQTTSAAAEPAPKPAAPAKEAPKPAEDASEAAPPAPVPEPKEEPPQEVKPEEAAEEPAYDAPNSASESQTGSARADEEQDTGPTTNAAEDDDEPSTPQAVKPAVEYKSVMVGGPARAPGPPSDDGNEEDEESEQPAKSDGAAAQPQYNSVMKQVKQEPVEDEGFVVVNAADAAPTDDENEQAGGDENDEAKRRRTEELQKKARLNYADNKIASLKKTFWTQWQNDKLEPITPWETTPAVVENILQFMFLREKFAVARVNKAFYNATNSPNSYHSLVAIPAFQYWNAIQNRPGRYAALKNLQCLRCASHQLNDQSFWTQQVDQASAATIRALAQACNSLENVVFGYLSFPENYSLLAANAQTLRSLQLHDSHVAAPQGGRIPDSLTLPRLEEIQLMNSQFGSWQSAPNLRHLAYVHMNSFSDQQHGAKESDIVAIAQNCRQLESFKLVYPPDSISDEAIAKVIGANQRTLRALNITRMPQSRDRQLADGLLRAILECTRLEILVIDGRLTDHSIWRAVEKLRRLRILEFNGASVTENGVKLLVQYCTNLQLLSLGSGCEPTAVDRIRRSVRTPDSLQILPYPCLSSLESTVSATLKTCLEMRVPNYSVPSVPNAVPAKAAKPVPAGPAGIPAATGGPQFGTTAAAPTSYPAAGLAATEATPPARAPPPGYTQERNATPPGIPIPEAQQFGIAPAHGIAADPNDFPAMGKSITYDSTPPAKDSPW